MYKQLFLKNSPFLASELVNFQYCIIAGNWLLIICGTVTAALLTMNFALEQYVSISLQIAGHVGTILSASLFKIGYVIRCVGVHGLGYKVF